MPVLTFVRYETLFDPCGHSRIGRPVSGWVSCSANVSQRQVVLPYVETESTVAHGGSCERNFNFVSLCAVDSLTSR
jgi:hypothetical protein